MSYEIVALIGESGCGKDTILKGVLDKCREEKINVNKIVNCTTRPMRENEKEGINYFYLTIEQFSDKILDSSMLEARQFNDWFYGTEISALKENQVNIGIFSPDAIYDLSESPQLKIWVYYMETSPKQRLLRQLNREDNPDVDEIVRRFFTDKYDFEDLQFYYNIIPNEDEEDMINGIDIIFEDIKLMEHKTNLVNEN